MQLRPMTQAEFDSYRSAAIAGYAQDHIRAGNWNEEEAQEQAEEEYAELLPDGLHTADMLLFTAEDEVHNAVGMLWLGLTHPRAVADTGWIYDIEIAAEHRRRGYGRALLAAAEQELADHGVSALALNVFGDNTAARDLYLSAGYEVTTQQMRKSLR